MVAVVADRPVTPTASGRAQPTRSRAMASQGLTFGNAGQQPQQQQQQQPPPPPATPPSIADSSRFSDSEGESRERSPTAKSPSEILSGVYRGIKKIAPSRDREDSAKLRKHPSQLALRNIAAAAALPVEEAAATAPLPSRGRANSPQPMLQHARNLSLQNSLGKPLPEPPPPQLSPASPLTPLAYPLQTQSSGSLAQVLDSAADMDNSRSNTMDSTSSAEGMGNMYGHNPYATDSSMASSQSSLGGQAQAQAVRHDGSPQEGRELTPKSNGPASAGPSPQVGQSRTPALANAGATTPGGGAAAPSPSAHLSGLMCNVHKTTGQEPHPLVGATTTILGDKLYVFGGRILSRSRSTPLTSDLYELDLIRRHWTKLETSGDTPPPRYFHSMCALGDTKMVCYGGMSPTPNTNNPVAQDQQPEVTVMSDIYIYDAPTKRWTFINTPEHPQGRYAHCACILPSSAAFAYHRAPQSLLQHNPPTDNPNEGRIGINIDGVGGSEMIVVGGQDGANHYIEEISVFNLRSLKWTSTQPLGKSCGAYRSVVAPLPPAVTARIGRANNANGPHRQEGGISQEAREPGSSMLIYSNYNFLDVKLELQIRSPDGNLTEKPMSGTQSPPGLRFPNGGVVDTHFVVSGTYLTSSKQEYALWALDLRNLTWSRIDAGGVVFSQGSWNRGVLWNRRNTFVVLGSRKRSLVDDYNHRRINFSNVCMVELEAFGFFDNPRKTAPMSGFVSASSPYAGLSLSMARKAGITAGGRFHSRASEELGEKALAIRELADMDILCLGGERVPINSRIVGRRWGPYFVQLLREGTATQDGSDVVTLRSGSISGSSAGPRMSNATTVASGMTRSTLDSAMSMAPTLVSRGTGATSNMVGTQATAISSTSLSPGPIDPSNINGTPSPESLPPNSRPRCLYLPHTYLTVQALLHFLYTSSLPQPTSPLCTPQILCSLLQIARPYRIDGLLEAVVERLHNLLDSRNAAAVFNATAMAAGGGRGIDGSLNPNFFPLAVGLDGLGSSGGALMSSYSDPLQSQQQRLNGDSNGLAQRAAGLRINTSIQQGGGRPSADELSASTSVSGSEWSSELGDSDREREIWAGELSSVIGLQKRGLRGLMEGRRLRERTGTNTGAGMGGSGAAAGGPGTVTSAGIGVSGVPGMAGMQTRVGLGIAGGA